MSSKGTCRLCGEQVVFTIGNPIELGFHMIEKHHGGSIAQYEIDGANGPDCVKGCRGKELCGKKGTCVQLATESEGRGPSSRGHGTSSRGHGTSSRGHPIFSGGQGIFNGLKSGGARVFGFTGGRSGHAGGASNSHHRRKYYTKGLYKTTLETWTASGGYVMCPQCGKEVKPLIRSQKNKVAYTSLGATFLLSCWPFCFLFPMMHKCSVDLYCPNCKYPLGVYDSATGQTRPKKDIPNLAR